MSWRQAEALSCRLIRRDRGERSAKSRATVSSRGLVWRAQVVVVGSVVPTPTEPARWTAVRATTVFNKITATLRVTVREITFEGDNVVLGVRSAHRRLHCTCGWSTSSTYDRSMRRWRHLDVMGSRVFLEAEIRRLRCGACERVVTEAVAWARHGRATRCRSRM